MQHGPLDGFLQLLLDLPKSSHVFPSHVWSFHVNLPHGGWLNESEGVDEIVHGDIEFIQYLQWDVVRVEVNLGEHPPQSLHRRLLAELREVRPCEAMRQFRDPRKVDIVREGHAANVDLEYLVPAFPVRDADLDLPVETPTTPERWVYGVGSICGTDHHHLASRLEPIHEGQKLGYYSLLDLPRHLLPVRSNGVDLVDEYDAGRALLGF